MKKISLFGIIVACSIQAWAQQSPGAAYWVVETNGQQKNYSIIRLYNQNNEQVHEVRLDGTYVDIRKPKYRKKLDKMLKDYSPGLQPIAKRNKSRKSI